MSDTALFTQIAQWLDQNVLVSTSLAVIGAAALFAFAVAGLVVIVRVLNSVFGGVGKASNRKIRRAAQEPGYSILIGEFGGYNSTAAGHMVETALTDYCSDFSFGAQFKLFRVRSPGGRPEGEVLRRARQRLEKTGADMIVWGARLSDESDGLRLFGVSRGGNLTPQQAQAFTLLLPGRLRAITEPVKQATAYLLAKRLQPALAHPESFREERVAQLGETLDTLLTELEALDRPLFEPTRREIETDFAATTLFLSETVAKEEWLERLIARRRATLDVLKGDPNTEAQIDARLDLGRALIKRAEKTFDPVAVREASVHLNAAIDALRKHDVIRKAQRASDALARAQSLVETRRRFAVNFSA
ncbi:MAG: hypothetical protein AAFQ22_05475 [Pseudomonadota bacterium]